MQGLWRTVEHELMLQPFPRYSYDKVSLFGCHSLLQLPLFTKLVGSLIIYKTSTSDKYW